MKSSKTPKMISFSWPTIEKLFVKIFSEASGISYWSKACSGRSGLSIAPPLDRFRRVQVKNDTIEKRWRTVSQFPPLKKRTCGQHALTENKNTLKIFLLIQNEPFFSNCAFFFRGTCTGYMIHLFQWFRFSPVRVRISWEWLRLIILIGLNMFLIDKTSPKPLKKFSRTTFWW